MHTNQVSHIETKLRLLTDSRSKLAFKYSWTRLVWDKIFLQCVLNRHQLLRPTVLLSILSASAPDFLVLSHVDVTINELVLTCPLVAKPLLLTKQVKNFNRDRLRNIEKIK